MSLIALKWVWAALIVVLIVVLMWLVAELLQAPPAVRRMAGWILAVVLAFGLLALIAASGGGLWVAMPRPRI